MNLNLLFDTLGKILSEKENAKITFNVKVKEGDRNMSNMTLFPHQTEALELSKGMNKVAYYHD